ncbi:hypothetical protein Bca52824_009153 [Brassica carinata]|uniref:F-box domain-containing protein n=1 Tax=Brassica carinata TaxID=52824 RepID=A0A8X8B8U8_BRACI|nr:hypothetical protein Bca52824_009153 [Brassica carinata]
MNRAETPSSIPIDLILEILSRLPSKSVGKFHCVSKLWRSMLIRPYFTELYLTRSSTRPRLLFAVDRVGEEEELHFYSSPQPQIPYDKSSLVVAADYHTTFTFPSTGCNYASGLICFRGKCYSGKEALTLICNPITGQYAELPKVVMNNTSNALLGFDPVDKQFKILLNNHPYCPPIDRHKTLTLGVPKHEWSNIVCPKHYTSFEGICISGVIYYTACARSKEKDRVMIVCFDVRCEEFKFIRSEFFCKELPIRLVNYKGKLGGISWKSDQAGATELRMWVLHDVEKQEWSKYVYPLPDNEVISLHKFSVAGMTTRGEIVLSMIFTFKPFYVFYFNPEKNTLRSVEIQGFGEDLSSVKVFVDHVEDFNFLR